MLRHFIKYDEGTGESLGLYNIESSDDVIPSPSIELSYHEWQTAIHNKCKVVDGVLTVIGISDEEVMEAVRLKRNLLLKESDWTQFPDSPLSTEKRAEWSLYRQALRDLPANVNIKNVVFPTEPQ